VDPGLVHDRVALAARDQPAVDGHGDGAGHDEREGEAAPEQQLAEAGLHRARHHEDDTVVDGVHRGDAQRSGPSVGISW
jgi:hypothetical protein